MSKLIKTWEELSKVPANDKYRLIIKDCCGWIVPICDKPSKRESFKCKCKDTCNYYEDHIYLSTHTFYGSNYKYSTEVLKSHGFDVEIDNWDKG